MTVLKGDLADLSNVGLPSLPRTCLEKEEHITAEYITMYLVYFAVVLTLNNISGLAICAWESEMLSKLTTGVGTTARACFVAGIPARKLDH